MDSENTKDNKIDTQEYYSFPSDLGKQLEGHMVMFSFFDPATIQTTNKPTRFKPSDLPFEVNNKYIDDNIKNPSKGSASIENAAKTFDTKISPLIKDALDYIPGFSPEQIENVKSTFKALPSLAKERVMLYMPQKLVSESSLEYENRSLGTFNAYGAKGSVADAIIYGVANFINKVSIGGLVGNMGLDQQTLTGGFSAVNKTVRDPYLAVLFKQVGLRNFSFTYSFFSRSESEAKTALDIIRIFKYYSHPSKTKAEGFVRFPAEVSVDFYTAQNGTIIVNDALSKLKRCYVTKINVDYTGHGEGFSSHIPITGSDGKVYSVPVQMNMTIDLQEASILSREDVVEGY